MLEWSSARVQNLVRSAVEKHQWCLPTHEADDLAQEAWVVYDRVRQKYTAESIRERYGTDLTDDAVRAVWYTLLRNSVRNKFYKLSRRSELQTHVDPEDLGWLTPGAAGRCDPLAAAEDPRALACLRVVEIQCDLEKTPGLRTILARSSWEDGKTRIREARTHADGSVESVGEVMQRLAGRRCKMERAADRRDVRELESELRRVV